MGLLGGWWTKRKDERMPMNCNLDGITGKGRCCCNCKHQMLAMKHPWNEGAAKGRVTEIMGALCAMPDMVSAEGRRQAVFFFLTVDTACARCTNFGRPTQS